MRTLPAEMVAPRSPTTCPTNDIRTSMSMAGGLSWAVSWPVSGVVCCALIWSVDIWVSLVDASGWMLVAGTLARGVAAPLQRLSATALQPTRRGWSQGKRRGRKAMRAREPDEQGYVDRGGVRIAYESFGDGDVTVLFPPVDVIVHSRVWKAQVPFLARHFRVVTIDPRGNGRSDRPSDTAAYGDLEYVGDTIAVMDHLGIDRAVMVGICYSAWQALVCAALHPDRLLGVVAIAPSVLDGTPPLEPKREAAARFDEELPNNEGWLKYNRHYWLEDWPDFVEFFFGELCSTPHSTKLLEDAVGWALEGGGMQQLAAQDAPEYATTIEQAEQVLQSVECPVLVVYGTDDRCQPVGRFDTVVRLTGAERIVIEGGSHLPMGRDPVVVNHAIKDFTDRVTGAPPPSVPVPRGAKAPPRVLYLRSPLGLGHVRR